MAEFDTKVTDVGGSDVNLEDAWYRRMCLGSEERAIRIPMGRVEMLKCRRCDRLLVPYSPTFDIAPTHLPAGENA